MGSTPTLSEPCEKQGVFALANQGAGGPIWLERELNPTHCNARQRKTTILSGAVTATRRGEGRNPPLLLNSQFLDVLPFRCIS